MIIRKILKIFKIKVKTIFWRYTKLIPTCHPQYKLRKGYGIIRHSPNPTMIVLHNRSQFHKMYHRYHRIAFFSCIRYSGNADNV